MILSNYPELSESTMTIRQILSLLESFVDDELDSLNETEFATILVSSFH